MIRWIFRLVFLALFVWFGATVPLGDKTLFGHLHAISATPEAQDFARGTRKEAERVAERVRQELGSDAGPATGERRNAEHLSTGDRRSLDHLVRDKQRR